MTRKSQTHKQLRNLREMRITSIRNPKTYTYQPLLDNLTLTYTHNSLLKPSRTRSALRIHTFGTKSIISMAEQVRDALTRLRSQEEIEAAEVVETNWFNQRQPFLVTEPNIPINPLIPTRYQTDPISISFPKQSLVSSSDSDFDSLSNLQELAQDTTTLTIPPPKPDSDPFEQLKWRELDTLLKGLSGKVTSIQFPI